MSAVKIGICIPTEEGYEAKWQAAMMQFYELLGTGKYVDGWRRLYEIRRKFFDTDGHLLLPYLAYGKPVWDGTADRSRRLFVFNDGGFGDVFLYCRFLAEASRLNGEIVLAVEPSLRRLLLRLPWIRSIPASKKQTLAAEAFRTGIRPLKSQLNGVDAVCPITMLPYFVGATDTGNAQPPYIKASTLETKRWAKSLPPGRNVGICWRGSNFIPRMVRSVKLTDLALLSRVPGVTWHCLQADATEQELADFPIPLRHYPGRFRDWNSTAGLIAALDMVVTVDTGLANLAGAMGAPVYIALGNLTCWRYGEHPTRTPWYPSARLFRQDEPDNWQPVFSRIAEDLSKHVGHIADNELCFDSTPED